MSYARFGGDSDVYVVRRDPNVILCLGCRLVTSTDDRALHSARAAYSHLQRHIAAGDRVPERALARLWREGGEETGE